MSTEPRQDHFPFSFGLGVSPGGRRVDHAFSTRSGGHTDGSAAAAASRFLGGSGFAATARPLLLRQVHGKEVFLASGPLPHAAPEADAAVTADADLALIIQTADCVPVLFADDTAGVIGAAHAGWRGALAGVIEATVATMLQAGADAARLRATLGPAIGPCCFAVGEEVAGPFAELDRRLVLHGKARSHVDLPGAVSLLLAAAGVDAGRQSGAAACTACDPERYASFRRRGAAAGRLLSGVALGRL